MSSVHAVLSPQITLLSFAVKKVCPLNKDADEEAKKKHTKRSADHNEDEVREDHTFGHHSRHCVHDDVANKLRVTCVGNFFV